jgi:virginiamycin B lyase
MNVRLLLAGTTGIALACGCAQGNVSLPTGGSPPTELRAAGLAMRTTPQLDFFKTPSDGAWPGYITSGPQNALWFSEEFTGYVGRITMDGTITEFSANGQEIEGITAGPDGNIWFTQPGASAIGRMTPKGGAKIFPIPGSPNASPRGITSGPDGNVWCTEFYDGYIDRITPQGVITRFPLPEGSASYPWDIKAGPRGYMYVSESESDRIARFDPKTQQFESSIVVQTPEATPWGMLYAPDKRIWFTERTGNKIAEILPNATIREFPIPQYDSYPEALAAGSDGKLWFTESTTTDSTGNLERIDPATGKFGAVIVLPTGDLPDGIASGPNKNIWFTVDSYTNPSQIGEAIIH